MSKKMKVHYSSATNEWATPKELYDKLNDLFGPFDLDPCSSFQNAKCRIYITKEQNGLNQSWNVTPRKTTKVFMNPPYGREIGKWVKKAYEEAKKGVYVVCLIPSRTDTSWWHKYCMNASEVVFFAGRVSFIRDDGKTGVAPFPSCLVIFNPKELDNFPKIGRIFA